MGPRADTLLGSAFWRPAAGWAAQWATLWMIQRFFQRLKEWISQWVILRVFHSARGISGRGWPDTVNQWRQRGARQTPGDSPPQGQRHRG